MATGNTKQTLGAITGNLRESMGVRSSEFRPMLAPRPEKKDIGRRPLRNIGKLAIDQIVPDPDQPRTEFDQDAIERLALSIREKGQFSPIRVRWSETLEKWIIIGGERRWRAAKRAELTEIECCFHETELTPSEILEQQLIENCLREDLQPIEEAKAFASLMQLNGWTGKQVADALRVHPSRVSRALALLKLPATVQNQVATGKISARSAYDIARAPTPKLQAELVRRAGEGQLTHQDAANAIRQRRGKPLAVRGVKQTFFGDNGWQVVVTGPDKGTYFEVEQALLQALEEVRTRINSGCQLF